MSLPLRLLSMLRRRVRTMTAATPDESAMPDDDDLPDLAEMFAPKKTTEAQIDADDTAKPKKRHGRRLCASDTLADLAVKSILTPDLRRRIKGRKTLCLLVQVPGADWTRPVVDALRGLGMWNMANEGEANVRNRGKEDRAITSCLSGGGRVLGVSHAPDTQLPLPILSAADVRLAVTLTDDRIISDVILAATGRRPKELPVGIARSLTYSEICAAVRIGSNPAQCVDRLLAAASARNQLSTLDDVPLLQDLAGYGDAMTWCTDLLADLDAWRRGGAPFPTSGRVVFAGPPGCGKTTLVRSLARTGQLTLVATSVGDWFANSPGNLDSVVKQIAEIFAAAQAASPAILFLDELDAMPDRATLSPRGRDWWLPVIAYLLTTLDSAVSQKSKNIVIIGATNYGDRIDAALVRPGRLEKIVTIETPDDPATRVGILRSHLKEELRDEDLLPVGRITARATGAELAGLVRRARRDARVAGRPLAVADLMALVMPPERRDAKTLRRVCVHEAGHVVLSMALGGLVRSVSIVPVGASEGRMTVEPTGEDLPLRADLERSTVILFGGAAAEEVIFGDRSLGAGGAAESDLARATAMLIALRTSFGLGNDLAYRATPETAARLLETDSVLRQEVEADMRKLFSRACLLVKRNRACVQAVAAAIETRRFLTAADISSTLEAASLMVVCDDPDEATACVT